MVQRAISNLLSNALRHSNTGSTVEIKILEKDIDIVSLAVTNHGATIESDHLPHLFDRFYRVNGIQPRGAGLGLAIVRSVMNLHKGHVAVASKDGRTIRTHLSSARLIQSDTAWYPLPIRPTPFNACM